ncbi:MAG: hypothetical protein LUQ21_06530, partial [Methanothrix sp.]|nr:hypothetical protein [Methanothrix sp.]
MAVLPGQLFSRTTLGFTDHHAAEILFSTLTMMFLILALHSGKGMSFAAVQKNWSAYRKPLIYAALTGVALGLYIDAWASGFLFEGIILLFVMLQSIFDHMKGKSAEYLGIIASIAFLVAVLLVLPFVDSSNGFSNYYYSLFHPTILLIGVAAAVFFSILSRLIKEKDFPGYYYPGALLGLAALGASLLYFVLPQFTKPLLAGFAIFQAKTGGAATVGEAASLFSEGGAFSFGNVLRSFPGLGALSQSSLAIVFSLFTLALIALVVMAVRNAKFQKPAEMLILSWSVIILIMTLAQNRFTYYYAVNVAILQNRFTYYYAVNVAILTGFLVIWALQKAGMGNLEKELTATGDQNKLMMTLLKLLLAVVLIFFLIIQPSLNISGMYARSAGGPDSDWLTSTRWLQNNTPSPGLELYEK